MFEKIKNFQTIYSFSKSIWEIASFVILIALPVIAGLLAFKSPYFSDPTIVFLITILSIAISIWIIAGINSLLKTKDQNPHTEIVFGLDPQTCYFNDYKLDNILRYDARYWKIQTIDGELIDIFWDVVILFEKPIGITTIRFYGLDGSKPNYETLCDNPYFARFKLKEVPTNKFRITFNEKLND